MLEWQASGPVSLILAQQADLSDAQLLYEGDGQSYFLSGLSDGTYFLRLEGHGGALSAPVTLTVAHQSLAQALWLTVIGLLITLGIIVTILRGARDD